MQLKRYGQQVYGATNSVSDIRTVCTSQVEAYSVQPAFFSPSDLQVAIRAAGKRAIEVIKRNRKLWQKAHRMVSFFE